MSIIATTAPDGVADELLFHAVTEITAAGNTPILIGRRLGRIRSRRRGRTEVVDAAPQTVSLDLFHGLLVPCDASGLDSFVRRFWSTGRPVAALSEGVPLVLRTGIARGRDVACEPDWYECAIAAGASRLEARMVVDGNLITARGEESIAAACRALENRIIATGVDTRVS